MLWVPMLESTWKSKLDFYMACLHHKLQKCLLVVCFGLLYRIAAKRCYYAELGLYTVSLFFKKNPVELHILISD